MKKRKIGIILIVVSLGLFIIERVTSSISKILGQLACGENYGKKVGDSICGFNMDMYVGGILFIVFVIGIVLVIVGKKKNKKAPSIDEAK